MRNRTLADIGEWALIQRLTSDLPLHNDVLVGAGDDSAVVSISNKKEMDLVLTSDPVIFGTHFDHSSKPELVGRKAIGRGLSDIAAMGAKPLWALINLSAPPNTSFDYVKKIYRGASAISRKFGLSIVGGDTARSGDLALHVFMVGIVKKGRCLLRSGARPGDDLFVTGTLGGSIKRKHLLFTPRIEQGVWLANSGMPTAMIDITDGLARDALHLAEQSKVSVCIDISSLPVSTAAKKINDNFSTLHHVLNDGEDFELLFTVPRRFRERLQAEWRKEFKLKLTLIGNVFEGKEALYVKDDTGRTEEIYPFPFNHFQGKKSQTKIMNLRDHHNKS